MFKLQRKIELHDQKPALPDVRDEVARGLAASEKRLSPKYFYDERGSRLFDEITRLPEYYPTRTEIRILRENRSRITKAIGDGVCLIEYGSGSSTKIRVLLESCRPRAYVPVDISKDHLLESARRIDADYDWLSVCPVCADYTRPVELPPEVEGLRRMAFFPGSSIGNFEPESAHRFLSNVIETIGPSGWLVIGVDTKKDPEVLNAAYNDSRRLTAQFNLNLLAHLNDSIGTDFSIEAFEHFAEYNADKGRVEMHLVSKRDQRVALGGTTFALAEGERIHTENSYKYHPDEFVALAEESGFVCRDTWFDPDRLFMVLLLQAPAATD